MPERTNRMCKVSSVSPRAYRPRFGAKLRLLLCLGCALWLLPHTDARPEDVEKKRIIDTITRLQALGNRTTWEKQWDAARWIVGEFERERIPARIETYDYQQGKWPNVVASIPGSDERAPIILVIAHLDSIAEDSPAQAPGADDNAAGIAVLVENARLLKEKPLRRPVVFGVFSNEERGAAGSLAFAKKMRLEGTRIHAVLNLDILGYNAPTSVLSWEAISLRSSFWDRVKVTGKMIKNYAAGWLAGNDRLVVAGRVANAGLVERVAGALQAGTGLRIDRTVRDDCG
jgi:hypothetical protein